MREIKCLFLACSGVRVKSEELRAIGVTLPGFIERGRVIASLPSLGLLTLASFCPENWKCEYKESIDFSPQDVKPGDYDIVAISCLTAQAPFAYSLAKEIRAKGIKVVMGGLHISSRPEEAQEFCDSVIVGEGEYIWQQLTKDFENGELKPFYNAKEYGYFNFKDARTPRYDLLDMAKYNRITVQTQRGCPRHCHFCAASHTISNYKCKEVDQVVREIQEISKYWPRPFIEFADDNTFLKRSWAKDLLRAIEPLDIRWFTETDISVADDDELLELISRSGCYQILIGLESANPMTLMGADPHQWKQKQFKKYKAAIDKIQSYGISVNGCFIVGWDHDTPEIFDQTARFIEELALAEVQVTILTPFPNTVLYQQLKAQGRLLQEVFWDACTLFDVTFQPKNMSVRELETGVLKLFKEIYSAQATAKRKAIFKQCVRNKQRLQKTRKATQPSNSKEAEAI
ncbi:MAG: radical SAM protein [Bdellovibrionota bacterium]